MTSAEGNKENGNATHSIPTSPSPKVEPKVEPEDSEAAAENGKSHASPLTPAPYVQAFYQSYEEKLFFSLISQGDVIFCCNYCIG